MMAVHHVLCGNEFNVMRVRFDEHSDSLRIERRGEVANPTRLTRHKPAIDQHIARSDKRIDECIEVTQFGVGLRRSKSRPSTRTYRQIWAVTASAQQPPRTPTWKSVAVTNGTLDVEALLESVNRFREGGQSPAAVLTATGVNDVGDEELREAVHSVLASSREPGCGGSCRGCVSKTTR